MTADERTVTIWANTSYKDYTDWRDTHPMWLEAQDRVVLPVDRDYAEWLRVAAEEARRRGYT